MQYNFDEVIDRKGTRCAKYDERIKKFGTEDLIPLWIADMDFKTAQPIIDACKRRAEEGILATLPDRIPILRQYRTGKKNAMTGARILH